MKTFQTHLQQEPKLELARKLKKVIWVLCGMVFLLVGLMRSPYKITLPEGTDLGFLPPVHAALNSLVTLMLLMALLAIKWKRIDLHKLSINTAMLLSVVFLFCYVAYHFTTVETRFGNLDSDPALSAEEIAAAGNARYAYLILLLTHIVFAAVSLPFICFSWMYGITYQFQKHRKMVRWVYPMWLYVAATGPICYFMLKPYYQ